MKNTASAKAHTNIALIKYWGKKDEQLIIPQNSSLSITLDEFYTQTTVTFDDTLLEDEFSINNKKIVDTKITNFLNLVKQQAGITEFAKVNSYNHVPMAAGFASSASAYAALAGAASKAAGLNLSMTDLSRLARKGSGSACRSIFGGFVEWHGGTDDVSSYAEQIPGIDNFGISILALTVNTNQKSISSRQGMQLSVDTSPYYSQWVKQADLDLIDIKQAIADKDFTKLGNISELNAMRMHALTISADPDFTYFNGGTLSIIEEVKQLRKAGIECYYTIDAGPNVKLICQNKDVTFINDHFKKFIGTDNVTVTKPGNGIEFI